MERLTVKQIEEATNYEVRFWPGDCKGVADNIVAAGLLGPEWVSVYGHYRGDVHPRSMFFAGSSVGFVQHGWVENESTGEIIDPTRWVFENVDPYIWHGQHVDDLATPCGVEGCGLLQEEHDQGHGGDCGCYEPKEDEYDRGGNKFRMERLGPAPAFVAEKALTLDLEAMADLHVTTLLGGERQGETLGLRQVHWLANLSPEALGPFAEPIFKAIIDAGWAGLIPIDNRHAVLGEKS